MWRGEPQYVAGCIRRRAADTGTGIAARAVCTRADVTVGATTQLPSAGGRGEGVESEVVVYDNFLRARDA